MARRREHLSAYLRICVSAYLRICVSAYLRICVSAYLRICVSAYLRDNKITKKQEIIIRHHLKIVTSI
jgi:hypothetical protein